VPGTGKLVGCEDDFASLVLVSKGTFGYEKEKFGSKCFACL